MKQQQLTLVERLFSYTIIFFILLEWLKPVMQLTNTGQMGLIALFIVLCLSLSLLKTPVIVSWLAKLAYIAWFVLYVYSDLPFFSIESAYYLWWELKINTMMLVQGLGSQVTDAMRSILFLMLIWMLIYLIHHWVTVRLTIFYFFVLTVFFIATLDTFTEYNGQAAIIKVVILGLLLTGVLYIRKLMNKTDSEITAKGYALYMIPFVLLISFTTAIALFVPKQEPIWPDPVPYFKTVAGKGGPGGGIANNSSVGKVGFGDNDDQLGGPFIPDDTVIYEIDSPSPQYYRVEMKDFYTSKGWELSGEGNVEQVVAQNEQFTLSMGIDDTEEEMINVRALTNDFSFILQPYRTTQVQTDYYAQPLFKLNIETERIVSTDNLVEGYLPYYNVIYQEPEYSYSQLKASQQNAALNSNYLQLPETLPERVRELAFEITENRTSAYEKARAIESYFSRSGFRYETEDVPIPTEEQDYVDQFLFETKFGYCDNFSTSMVVMLRAIGIEARWVKGFAEGEQISNVDGLRTFEITNNNAHSWVEAYIDGVGWMPFEPTIGYSNPLNIDYDIELTPEEEEDLPEQREEPETAEEEKEEQATSPKFDFSKLMPFIYGMLGFVLLFVIVGFFTRKKWVPKMVIQQQRSKQPSATSFEQSYLVLLKQLERAGIKRQRHETLQQYAKKVDLRFETDEMSILTDAYEKVIYGTNIDSVDFVKMKEYWEHLINRTTG